MIYLNPIRDNENKLRNWEDYNKIARSENALENKDDYQNLYRYQYDTSYIDCYTSYIYLKRKKKYEKRS